MISAREHGVSDLPRVLVVTSNNFNLRSGGGITLSNLFRGWTADRIANLHEDPTSPDRSVCPTDFRLTRGEMPWSWPFGLVERWAAVHSNAYDTRALAVPSGSRTLKRWLFGDGVPRDGMISPALESWIEAFRPDLVYGFLGSTGQIRLVRRIAERWHLPIAVHIMDDWPAVIYTDGVLGRLLRPSVLREFRDILQRAAVRFVISNAMAEEYQRRYGLPFLAFQNALDMREWSGAARRHWTVGRPAIVRYVGSILGEAQREALRDVCDAVVELRAEGWDVAVSVHTPEAHGEALRSWGYGGDAMRIEHAPASSEVPRLLADADVLLLPFNFDASSVQYMRLSMPTKVPAYMVSGTPVLVYGPTDVAAVAYAEQGGWGSVVTDRGAAAVKVALHRLLTDVAYREALGRRAMALARQNHDIERVRAGFWSALALAASPVEQMTAAAGDA